MLMRIWEVVNINDHLWECNLVIATLEISVAIA